MIDEKWGPVLEAVKALVEARDAVNEHYWYYKCLGKIDAVDAAYRDAVKPAPPPIEPGFYWARLLEPKSDDMVVCVCRFDGKTYVFRPANTHRYDLSEWVIIAPVEPPNASASDSMKPVFDAAMEYTRLYDAWEPGDDREGDAYRNALSWLQEACRAEANGKKS